MLTRQEIFDKGLIGIRKQGRPAFKMRDSCGITCQYRTFANGRLLKCFVGQLIDEPLYDVRMEGATITQNTPRSRVAKSALFSSGVDESDLRFVSDLQQLHDNWAQCWHVGPTRRANRNFEREVKQFAMNNDLAYLPPQGGCALPGTYGVAI